MHIGKEVHPLPSKREINAVSSNEDITKDPEKVRKYQIFFKRFFLHLLSCARGVNSFVSGSNTKHVLLEYSMKIQRIQRVQVKKSSAF